jgi:hypothetical protein
MRLKTTFGRITFSLILLLVVLCMTSCALIIKDLMAHPEKLAGTQKDSNFRGVECRNVLIVGLIEDISQRVAVENVFTDRLTQQGLQVIVGSLMLPDLSLLNNRAFIDKLMQDEHIDHVITLEAKDVADNDLPGWLRIWLATPLPKGDLTDVALSRGMTINVRFEIVLWDVKSMKREWTGTTHPLNRFDILRDVAEAADSTAYMLKKDKILRR